MLIRQTSTYCMLALTDCKTHGAVIGTLCSWNELLGVGGCCSSTDDVGLHFGLGARTETSCSLWGLGQGKAVTEPCCWVGGVEDTQSGLRLQCSWLLVSAEPSLMDSFSSARHWEWKLETVTGAAVLNLAHRQLRNEWFTPGALLSDWRYCVKIKCGCIKSKRKRGIHCIIRIRGYCSLTQLLLPASTVQTKVITTQNRLTPFCFIWTAFAALTECWSELLLPACQRKRGPRTITLRKSVQSGMG